MGQVGNGRLAARQDDQIGLDRQGLAGSDDPESDAGFLRQGVEIVEIGDAVQVRDGNYRSVRIGCERFLE